MFDKIVHEHQQINRDNYITQKVEVTENKAPTDESVRLLKEFEKEALGRIVEQIQVNDNEIKGCTIFFLSDLGYMSYVTKFSINGKEYVLKDKFNHAELLVAKESALKHIAQQIAISIVEQLLPTIKQVFGSK